MLRLPSRSDSIEEFVSRMTQSATVHALEAGRSPARLLALTYESLVYQSRFAASLERSGSVACGEGCVWCCYLMVHVTAPEALLIATYIRETVSTAQADLLRRHLAQAARRARRHGTAGYDRARIPCGLLVKNRCAVYPVRPINCRACVSPDRALCKDEFDQRSQRSVTPTSKEHRSYAAGLKAGLLKGLLAVGINTEKASMLELNNAVTIALEAENATERWLAGALSFDSAYGL